MFMHFDCKSRRFTFILCILLTTIPCRHGSVSSASISQSSAGNDRCTSAHLVILIYFYFFMFTSSYSFYIIDEQDDGDAYTDDEDEEDGPPSGRGVLASCTSCHSLSFYFLMMFTSYSFYIDDSRTTQRRLCPTIGRGVRGHRR